MSAILSIRRPTQRRCRRLVGGGRRNRIWTIERLEDRLLLANLTVNSLLDTIDANPGDGIAEDASGMTTLRAAVMEANASAGDDVIQLGDGVYSLTLAGSNEDAAATGDLDVTAFGQLTITGTSAATSIIDAEGLADRVFHVLSGASLNVSGLTIRNGDGGGILNSGMLTIDSSSVVNVDTHLHGTSGDDAFLLRLDATENEVQVFANHEGVGMPIFTAAVDSFTSLVFDTLAGDDRLIVDLVNGNPIPNSSVQFAGGEQSNKDALVVRGEMDTAGEYLPSQTTSTGVVVFGSGEIMISEVELIDVSRLQSFTVVPPNSRNELFMRSLAPGVTELTGASSLKAEIVFSNIATFIIDAAAHDAPGQSSNDTLSVYQAGDVPNETGLVQFRSGLGANTLLVLTATARIDATVDPAAVLNTTVTDRGHLITHRFRQSSLALGGGSRATILPDGTDAATSVLDSLTIRTDATLEINDNAVILDYTDESPVDTIRSQIIEGRGGAGLGKGWTGTGITSSAAAQANEIAPDSRSVGYAENALLPLGRYTTFRGHPIDDTAVFISYTRTGDANLDGVVNNDDVTIVGGNFVPDFAKPAWMLGDFEYNGFVDNDDVTLLDAFYNPAAAPEPVAPPDEGPATAGRLRTKDEMSMARGAQVERRDAAMQNQRHDLQAVRFQSVETITQSAAERSRAHLSFFESLAHSDDSFASPRRKKLAKWIA